MSPKPHRARAPSPTAPAAEPITLADLMARMAAELAALAETVEEVEAASSDAGGGCPGDLAEARGIVALQGLDLLRQSLADLARLTERTAAMAPLEALSPAEVEALAGCLTLGTLRRSCLGAGDAPTETAAAGHLDLF